MSLTASVARRVSISDLIALFKPRIAAMTLLSAAGVDRSVSTVRMPRTT